MRTASELKVGMALRIDNQIYKVVEMEAKAGSAKMLGTVRTRLSNVRGRRILDLHFRPLERLDDVELEKRKVAFLYNIGDSCVFQRLDTFEQFELPSEGLGLAAELLPPGVEVAAEFFEGQPIGVVVPSTVEAHVKTTAPPARAQQDSARKEAILENGLKIQVPLFVGPGEVVSIDAANGRYVERVRTQHKRSA